MEPQKPFACTLPDCGMTFTNEDHLHVHTRKHDMVLQLGMEQKAAFVADQTPTPTRFIRNCEEVGLFQDLQNVNPFDEGFKRAMETKHGILSLEGTSTEDALHTPHLVFPLESGDCTLYTANNQRNITISRSSSDESGAVKEYETTTISKLTNEVTTISRVVGKERTDDVSIVREEMARKDCNETVYTNNVIKIHSNVEIRKDNYVDKPYIESNNDRKEKIPPIMSQKSLDHVVDSLTSDTDPRPKLDDEKNENYEVIIKLPNGKHVRMKAVDEVDKVQTNTLEKLKKVIKNKVNVPNNVPSVIPLPTGTLIPVTLVSPPNTLQKIPIVPLPAMVRTNFKSVKRKCFKSDSSDKSDVSSEWKSDEVKNSKHHLDSRSAASKRYRERLKQTMQRQSEENKYLREINQKLNAEKAVLKLIITQHLKKCPMSEDLRNIQDKLQSSSQNFNNLDE